MIQGLEKAVNFRIFDAKQRCRVEDDMVHWDMSLIHGDILWQC
ncbi:hypothetical protein MNBD_NITROSPIRAE01-1301 [hydrothermal vent metagenome]|uniref:Uncharacterized protein n=1 Tax=hydrothermal vent metagenome TaxID=652676 RepID=A0A3B1CI65_9ZZZZ